MQKKRKREPTCQNPKVVKLDLNSTSVIRTSASSDKCKETKKITSVSPSKNVATRSSARLNKPSPSFPQRSAESIKSKKSESTSVVATKPISCPTIASTSSVQSSIATSKTIKPYQFNPTSFSQSVSTAKTHTTGATHKTKACQKSDLVSAGAFYTNYCLINENNLNKIIQRSLTATFYMKVMLTSLKNEVNRLPQSNPPNTDLMLKQQKMIVDRLSEEYLGYKQSVLAGITIPQRLHNTLVQQTTPHTPSRNNSTKLPGGRSVLKRSYVGQCTEVIAISDDSDEDKAK